MNQHQPKPSLNQPPKKKQKKKPNLDQFSTYAKYSGLAFQMIAIMGLAVWGGLRLDKYMGHKFPVLMIIFALVAFAVSLYIVIKGLPKN